MSGGTKHDQEKIRMELVPSDAIEALAQVLTFGAKKYAAWNWAKGFDWSRLYGATLRHLTAWYNGDDKDPETGFSHLAHALCCIVFLVAHEKRGLGTDDRHRWPQPLQRLAEQVKQEFRDVPNNGETIAIEPCELCHGEGKLALPSTGAGPLTIVDCGHCQ